MKLKNYAVIGLSAGVLLLAGCNTTKKMGGPQSDYGVATSGYGAEGGFGGGGLHMSAAQCNQAPSNQSYYFDLNQYGIHQSDGPCVNTQAKYLIAHPSAKVRLDGYCDNRGSREYNLGLGTRRANALKSALLQKGVSPQQITTYSWGSEKASPGVGAAVWDKDRRVDLSYQSK